MSKYEEVMAKVEAVEAKVKAIDERINKLPKEFVYNYVDENMPDWARPIIAALQHVGILKGVNDRGDLELTFSDLRSFVIDYRTGVHDKVLKVTRDANNNIVSSPIVEMFKEEMVKRYGK